MNRLTATSVGLLLLVSCQQGGGDVQQPQPAPAINSFTVSPTNIAPGESATYNWQVDADTSASCQLDIGNDGDNEYTLDCATGSQTHTFPEPGSFPATLMVTAAGQSVSKTAPAIEVEGASGSFTKLTWEPTTPMPYKVAEGQGVALNGKLYVFGGFDSESPYRCCRPTDRAYAFDLESETWQKLASMPPMNGTEYGGVNHAGFTTDGQDIYFAGGYTSNDNNKAHIFGTREAWRYNVDEDSYTRLPDLPEIVGSGQLEYLDGHLYFFGGSGEKRKVDTGGLYIFDLDAEEASWSEGASLPNPRNHLGSAVLDGKIYAIAGQHKHDGNLTTQDDVHAYDPNTDSWQQVASLPIPLSHHTASSFAMGGRIIVVGGEIDHLKAVADVFAYDPKTDIWTALTPLPLPNQSAVVKNIGNKIIMAGGSGGGWRQETFIGTPVE